PKKEEFENYMIAYKIESNFNAIKEIIIKKFGKKSEIINDIKTLFNNICGQLELNTNDNPQEFKFVTDDSYLKKEIDDDSEIDVKMEDL
ncbi:16241_t:CDS:2, partial [Cetraspora pellucida]